MKLVKSELYSLCLWLLLLCNAFVCSWSYKNIRLQDYLCADKLIIALQKPFRGDPYFTLMGDRDSAAIITQTWNTSMPGIFFSNKLRYDCKFRVQTPEHAPRGIYTIITRLKLRTDPLTGECLDFIQFSRGNRAPSERICNDISIDGPGGRLIFDQRHRDVNVYVHIDKNHMIKEPLELRMVLTAHAECRNRGDFLCDPRDSFSCISRYFVRDNITNCMFPCRDELSCFHDAIATEDVDTTNVALSALTSLIFTMLGVGICVWVCWKYWNCITEQQHAHEASAAAQRRHQQDLPTIDVPTAPVFDELIHGSAVVEVHQQTHQHNQQTPKDLPPSYESLFPER